MIYGVNLLSLFKRISFIIRISANTATKTFETKHIWMRMQTFKMFWTRSARCSCLLKLQIWPSMIRWKFWTFFTLLRSQCQFWHNLLLLKLTICFSVALPQVKFLVWFLYDHYEIIQIIYDLVWLQGNILFLFFQSCSVDWFVWVVLLI